MWSSDQRSDAISRFPPSSPFTAFYGMWRGYGGKRKYLYHERRFGGRPASHSFGWYWQYWLLVVEMVELVEESLEA